MLMKKQRKSLAPRPRRDYIFYFSPADYAGLILSPHLVQLIVSITAVHSDFNLTVVFSPQSNGGHAEFRGVF